MLDPSLSQPRVVRAGGSLLEEVDTSLFHVLQEWIEQKSGERFRDDEMLSYEREDGRIGFVAPKRLFEAFRADSSAMGSIMQRQTEELMAH